jgi:hypothetical protein
MSSRGDLRNRLRMSDERFEALLNLIKPFIRKQDTSMIGAIGAPYFEPMNVSSIGTHL